MTLEHLGDTATLAPAAAGATARLLVIENGSSSVHAVPVVGSLVVGRAAEADLRVEHASVSRKHARFAFDGSTIHVEDLGSHNGTRVNGEPIERPHALDSGDVVTVGDVVLVIHGMVGTAPARRTLGEAEWRRRLDEEVARALAYRRSLAVTVIVNVPQALRAAAAEAVGATLRLIDVVGVGGDAQLCVLHPELAPELAHEAASTELARLVRLTAPGAAAGYACCPSDACDADTLLLAALAAARAASGGQVLPARDAVTRVELGERRVLLAHPTTLRVYDLIKRLAAHALPVLISGETGAGKENAAYAVHWWSSRNGKPFVTINCAAIPENLVESELFGHDKGAFSGAVAARSGVFEAADGGTIFLDEIGELPLAAQAKLLRVLEAKKITRLGEIKERAVDVRVVAATNRALADEVKAGRFREDLYFRLGAATVILPPLRERRTEIPVLARELLAQACARAGRAMMDITPAAMQLLVIYGWPGNVRELRNAMDFVAAAGLDDHVEPDDLPVTISGFAPPAPAPEPPRSEPTAPPSGFTKLSDEIEALERRRMREALDAAGGVKTKAAALIGMPIRTFAMKLKQYGMA